MQRAGRDISRADCSRETIAKPFSRIEDVRRKRIAAIIRVGFRDGRSQMAALVQALSRVSAGTSEETETLKLIALFCGAGRLVSILLALYGPAADLTSGFF
jgi:hypothetical protein